MARCCVLIAPGFEEIEAVTVIDVLRRAGVEVLALGLDATDVQGSHGITLRTDGLLADHAPGSFDLVVLPGGMPGSTHLRDDGRVQAFVAAQHEAARPLAAICAAPIALASAGVLDGRRATSYPGFDDQLPGADYRDERVVVDGHLTTSRSPGTALEFALALVAQLVDDETARGLAEQMLVETAGASDG